MPNLPSWDDLLRDTPLNMQGILDAITKGVAALPSGFGAEEVGAVVSENVAQAFSLENLTASKSAVVPKLAAFFAAGGSGPVEKSPTDVI